jgi:hypothetical protein
MKFLIVVKGGQPPCWCNETPNCSYIHAMLSDFWRRCCTYESDLKDIGIDIKNACGYLAENISNCCKNIPLIEGGWFNSVYNFFYVMKLCEQGLDYQNDGLFLDGYELATRLPTFFEIIKSQIKNFKNLWNNRKSCQ